MITSPLGLFGFIALVNVLSPFAAAAIVVCYAGLLLWMIPITTWIVTTMVLAGLYGAVQLLSPSWLVGAGALVLGYFGQDLAHLIAGERTLQSTYIDRPGKLGKFVEHTLLLLPVLLVIAGRRRQSPFRLLVARNAVLKTKLTSRSQQEDLNTIRLWVQTWQPNLVQSTHWWQHELTGDSRAAFDRLSHDRSLISMIQRFHGSGYDVHPVLGMNELYVTGPPKQNSSDSVFYMGHVDGPWAVFPGARLYRCMLAAGPNAEVTTQFPMCGLDYHRPEGYRLETGDAVAFDFNRELHYITRQPCPGQSEPRVNLKLHFVAYPKSLPWYGTLLARLTTKYDVQARQLFLQTIDPNSRWQKIKADWVLGWTKTFEWMMRYVGWTNLAYIALAAVVSAAARDIRPFLILTSFVHYAIYVATFRERRGVSFGLFRRNAVLFKSLATAQLLLLYVMHFSGQFVSLGVVVAGFALATYATWVLGFNRTYFSAELGFDSKDRIARFPYGVIPHPMILGAMIGISGMLLVPSFREAYGWLIAAHLICYSIVLAQESATTAGARLAKT